MKKRILQVIASFTILFSYGQNDKQSVGLRIDEDKFTYEKIDILNTEEGNIPFQGNEASKKTDSKSSDLLNKSSGSGIGETLGVLSVSLTGGASYTVPIATPPGINGVAPEISLFYNSQSGNGLAGYGWNISGVSVISRTPSTKYHDNEIDCVDYDSLDRFALDGERLILTSGVIGGNGTEYRTEKYSNLKVRAYGTSPYGTSYGPSYFRVDYPDGSFAQYGLNSNSRSRNSYSITYWQNPQGVRISYEYLNENNSQTIRKIKYGSLYSSSINEINFFYDPSSLGRRDQSFVGEISLVRRRILKNIEVYSSGTRYRKYSLDWDRNNLMYHKLTSIKEYSGDNTLIHTPIYFDYSQTSSGGVNYVGMDTSLGLTNIHQENAETISLDLTGNGSMDFIAIPKAIKNKFWIFDNIQTGSFNSATTVNTGTFETIFPTTSLNYQNKVLGGQGITVVQNGSNNKVDFKVYSKAPPSSGSPIGYDYTIAWNAPTYWYEYSPTSSINKRIPQEYISGDFNGDGLTDVLAIGKPYTDRYCYEYECPSAVNVVECPDPLPTLQKKISKKDSFSKHIPLKKKSVSKKGDVIESFRPPPIEDCEGGGSSTCYSCNTYTSNNKTVSFINLKRNLTTSFSNTAGSLQLHLSGVYKLKTGDFNGDGKTDLLHVTNDKLYIYSLDKSNRLSLVLEMNSDIDPNYPLLLGDYNGDGKTDILAPVANNSNSFKLLLSTGTTFIAKTRTMPFKYKITDWNGDDGVLSGYSLVPLDVNGDGKTDIVEYNTTTYNSGVNGSQYIRIFNNRGLFNNSTPNDIDFLHGGSVTKTGDLKHLPIPIFLSSNQQNKNLEFASISDNKITSFSFLQDHREDVLLRSIRNNGVTHTIEYGNLDATQYSSDNLQVYKSSYDNVYPYVNVQVSPGTKVVTKLERISSGATTLKKLYSYQDAVYNAEGLGFLGFKGISRSNWHTSNSDRIFNTTKYDPLLRGAVTAEYSQSYNFSFNVPSSDYISKTTYLHSSSLASNKIFKLWVTNSYSHNNLDGTYANASYQYDVYNNPTNISTIYLGGNTTQSISYSNDTGTSYHIGRPLSIIETSTIDGENFNSETQFVYTGNLLAQRKTKGNGTPFDVETYTYDVFGNVLKKSITPDGMPAREISLAYDSSGRFLTKFTDAEGLETDYQYDNVKSVLTRETNPFGQETNYVYDSWDRQIKMIDYLGNEVSTSYTEFNYGYYTVANSADDGSEVITIYDRLKRISEVKEKNILGQWVSTNYLYDKFDRLWKASEPYTTGSNATQWSETSYDFYGRVEGQSSFTGREINISYSGLSTTVDDGTKTVTTTKDGLGNILSVTDPGGTINYKYYGNGGLKNTNYNGVIVATEQDGWGRKTKLTDPSAGVFEYEYNGFGELINETTPKGETDYVYSPIGKLTHKNITGENTNMAIQYSYNPTNKFLSTISLTGSEGNSNYSYSYDTHARLTNILETNSHAQFIKKYTYDAFGRVNTEQYDARLLSNNKISSKKIKNVYQNGDLKTVQDFSTNEVLWNINDVNVRGQVTIATMGTNMKQQNSYDAFGYLTESKTTSSAVEIMKLTTSFNVERGTLNSRTNSLFSWSESFSYDNLDRLVNFNDNDGENNHAYDSFGRITTNNTIGEYSYSGTSYKVENIALNNEGDLYYQNNKLQQIKYNAFKKPIEINETGKEKTGFQYNAFMGRSHMYYGDTEDDILDRNNRKHYSYDGSMEISYDNASNTSTFITYIGGDAYSAPAIWRSEQGGSTTNDYYYLHRDYLGSILMISDKNGTVKEKRHFDAWGNIVKLTDGNNIALDKFVYLDRGYTGHEHLQGVNLVHMNGRLYDPKLRRFLSPDNNIQDISNTQNFNRYAYVLNNPLMYVDPSGETYNDWGDETPGGLSTGQQTLIGAIIGSAYSALEGTDFRGFRNFVGNNFQSAVRDVVRPVREIGRWVRRMFGEDQKPAAPVEFNNTNNLTSDPAAGSSMSVPIASFGAGGTAQSNLGITTGDVLNTVADFIPIVGSVKDISQGFRDGNGWMVALGVGGLILDVATLGSASLIKGAIKTGVKQGIKVGAKTAAKRGAKTWNQFQKQTAGQFASRADASSAWSVYKTANGITTGTIRNQAVKRNFLKTAGASGNYPKWMNQWLSKGKVPPGYNVDHQKALFDGGLDILSNLRLKDIATHINRHRTYRP